MSIFSQITNTITDEHGIINLTYNSGTNSISSYRMHVDFDQSLSTIADYLAKEIINNNYNKYVNGEQKTSYENVHLLQLVQSTTQEKIKNALYINKQNDPSKGNIYLATDSKKDSAFKSLAYIYGLLNNADVNIDPSML